MRKPLQADAPPEVLLQALRDRIADEDILIGDVESDRAAVAVRVAALLQSEEVAPDVVRRVVDDAVDELVGYGPLEALLCEPDITEIMVNGWNDVWVERAGRIVRSEVRFRDRSHLLLVLDRLLMGTGRRIDETSPIVDARLADGSRLNAVLAPVAAEGPVITIRRFGERRLLLRDLIAGASLDGAMAAFLHAAILGRTNTLVSGATGAGKTTLLAAIADLTPVDQRLIVIEDVRELALTHVHAISQECRPASVEGVAAIDMRDLVRNALRMRPDRLIVGEVRGVEAAEMVQAMNTGHDGSMTTLHANSAVDAIARLEAMLAMAWPAIGIDVLRRWIATAIDVVIHCERIADGRRRIASISTVDIEGGEIVVDPLFVATGDGFRSCGRVPDRCLERMRSHGVDFPAEMFGVAA